MSSPETALTHICDWWGRKKKDGPRAQKSSAQTTDAESEELTDESIQNTGGIGPGRFDRGK